MEYIKEQRTCGSELSKFVRKYNIFKLVSNSRKSKQLDKEIEHNYQLVQLEDFCPVGDRFYYLGISMLCVSHYFGEYGTGWVKGIKAQYIDHSNKMHELTFKYDYLDILRKENERGATEFSFIEERPDS